MDLSKFNAGRRPSERILNHSTTGCYAIIHFGLNTYTGREWGYGNEDPSLFNPDNFDAGEIIKICKEVGLDGAILVCKHHDGFCLWPTATTEHNISKSPFRNGKGDLVREFADACAEHGLKMGFYVSPWDRNSAAYGTSEYLTIYREQLREIYSNYGPTFEAWFDGANGGDGWYGGANEKRSIDHTTYYDWENTWAIVRQLQPNAAIFSDVGPDLRWVGNERGLAAPESFGCYTPRAPEAGKACAPGFTVGKDGEAGTADGLYYMPPECDVPLRAGWFHHEVDDTRVRTLSTLVNIYLRSVGCGGFLNLGLAPDQSGRLSDVDCQRLRQWKEAIDGIFKTQILATEAIFHNNTAEIPLNGNATFNLVDLAEIGDQLGSVQEYEVLLRTANGECQPLISGQAIGRRRLKRLDAKVAGTALVIRVNKSAAPVQQLKIACYDSVFPAESENPAALPAGACQIQYAIKGNAWTVELPVVVKLAGAVYVPSPDLPPGTPDRYKLLISTDGKEWLVASQGEFSNIRANPVAQIINFDGQARYLRLEAVSMIAPAEKLSGINFGLMLNE